MSPSIGTRRCPYAVLGVDPDADQEELRHAYYEQCRWWHPDANPNIPAERAHQAMVRLNAAWELIGEPERRRQYDAEHAPAAPPWPDASPSPSASSPGPGSGQQPRYRAPDPDLSKPLRFDWDRSERTGNWWA